LPTHPARASATRATTAAVRNDFIAPPHLGDGRSSQAWGPFTSAQKPHLMEKTRPAGGRGVKFPKTSFIDWMPLKRAMRIVASGLALALLAGCESSTGTVRGPTATGDERGGRLAYAGNIAAANGVVRAHCEQFRKKGYITQMNLWPEEGGTIVFECR
jgi:hypothetical protein